MIHRTLSRFWKHYDRLPLEVRRIADKNFVLLKTNPDHPSLDFKKLKGHDDLWSVRAGLSYRALAREQDGKLFWFWIGTHAGYDRLIS